MTFKPLDRSQLSEVFKNFQTLRSFEQALSDVASTPSTIEEANTLAGNALSLASQSVAILADLMEVLEQLTSAPRTQLGSISSQNADAVEITGGTIGLDSGTVALPSFYLGGDRTTGLYRIGADNWGLSISGAKLADFSSTAAAFTQNVSTTKQVVSTVATGTAPLVVSSTTLVGNLYVARAVLADTATSLTSPSSFPADATDLPTVIALANALKSAAIAKGL